MSEEETLCLRDQLASTLADIQGGEITGAVAIERTLVALISAIDANPATDLAVILRRDGNASG